jgi:tetratricopeptide (TPR) repeat protein
MRNSVRFLFALIASAYLCGNTSAAVPSGCTTDTKDQEAAIAVCTTAIDSVKSSKDDVVAALKIRAELHVYIGNKDDAQADLTRALDYRPNDSSIYAARAAAREDYDGESAIADMGKAIGLHPKKASYYVQRAKLRLNQSQGYRAETDFSDAIKLEPKNPDLYEERLNFYTEQHEFVKALADVTKMIELGKTQRWLTRAQIYIQLGRYSEAMSDLDKVVTDKEFDPDKSSITAVLAYGMRGYCNITLNQIDKAVADYSKAITAFDHPALRMLRGNAFVQMKQYELAIQDYTALLKDKPDNVDAYHLRATAYELNGQSKLALSDRTEAALYASGLKQPKKVFDQ